MRGEVWANAPGKIKKERLFRKSDREMITV
jgi:hypothetical protein